ncbi:MAG: hypothetical protein KBF30_01095 [Hyphomonadaceae bacterium]|nr:hypothetical protein [Hyphomonadaceae bacterium]
MDAPFDPTLADIETRNLLFDTAPERSAELEIVLENIDFRLAADRPAFHLEATAIMGRGLVVFTPRTMRQIWLIGFMAWQCMHEQSGFIVGFLIQGRPYDLAAPDAGDAGAEAAGRIVRLGAALRTLREAQDERESDWPSDVPVPPIPPAELDEEDQAAYELACFALSFVMLHESWHALARIAGHDYAGREEELACDSYAAHLLLDRVGDYAKSKAYTPDQTESVSAKRAIGVFLGLVLMLESTEIGLREPTEDHPAWTERMRAILAIIEGTTADENGSFWVFATSVMLSRLRRDDIEVGIVPYDSARQLFYLVLDKFERG